MILDRFMDRGRVVVYRVAHLVVRCGFDEKPNSTAHGGTVVNNKESGPARAGHGRENYYRAPRKTMVLKFVKFVFFRIESDPDKSIRNGRRNILQVVFGQAMKGALRITAKETIERIRERKRQAELKRLASQNA